MCADLIFFFFLAMGVLISNDDAILLVGEQWRIGWLYNWRTLFIVPEAIDQGTLVTLRVTRASYWHSARINIRVVYERPYFQKWLRWTLVDHRSNVVHTIIEASAQHFGSLASTEEVIILARRSVSTSECWKLLLSNRKYSEAARVSNVALNSFKIMW